MAYLSVIMSTYNRSGFLPKTIDSILSQSFNDFEFIIFDDASTDNTNEILESYARKDKRIIHVRKNSNYGLTANSIEQINISKGKYIVRMDDDDIALPNKFSEQVRFMDINDDIAVCGTFIQIIGQKNGINWVNATEPSMLEVLMNFYNPICHPSVFIRKDFLLKHNLNYDKSILCAGDYHLWKKIIEKNGKLANIDKVLLKYRIHKNRITEIKKTQDIQIQVATAIKEELLKRFFDDEELFEKCKKVLNNFPWNITETDFSAVVENILLLVEINRKKKIIDEKCFQIFLEAVKQASKNNNLMYIFKNNLYTKNPNLLSL